MAINLGEPYCLSESEQKVSFQTKDFGISKTAAGALVRLATGNYQATLSEASLARALQRFGMLPRQAPGPLGMFSTDDIRDACVKHKAAIAGAIKPPEVREALRKEVTRHRQLSDAQIKRLSRKANKAAAMKGPSGVHP